MRLLRACAHTHRSTRPVELRDLISPIPSRHLSALDPNPRPTAARRHSRLPPPGLATGSCHCASSLHPLYCTSHRHLHSYTLLLIATPYRSYPNPIAPGSCSRCIPRTPLSESIGSPCTCLPPPTSELAVPSHAYPRQLFSLCTSARIHGRIWAAMPS